MPRTETPAAPPPPAHLDRRVRRAADLRGGRPRRRRAGRRPGRRAARRRGHRARRGDRPGAGRARAAGPRRWVPASALGMAAGLGLGASAVGYGTSLGELAVMGALTGVPLGLAQAAALPAEVDRRWVWAAALVPLWALGWTVTTLVGIDVEAQYTVFGSSGAIV